MTYVDFEFEAVSSSRSYPDVSGVEQGSKERIFGKKPVSDTFPFHITGLLDSSRLRDD